jgi:hypothetical protein
MTSRRLLSHSIRRSVRDASGSSGVAPSSEWSPLDITPIIYAIADTAYITESGGVVSAIANQGTSGGSFEQAVAGLRVPIVADAFGAGLHGLDFDANGQYVIGSINPASPQITVVVGGIATNAADYRRHLSAGATPDVASGLLITSGVPAVLHYVGVDYSIRLGTSSCVGSAHWVRSTHDTTLTMAEAQLWFDGSSQDGGDLGYNGNNAGNLGSMSYVWGGQLNGMFPWLGLSRFVIVVPRLLTAGEVTALDAWCAEQLGVA